MAVGWLAPDRRGARGRGRRARPARAPVAGAARDRPLRRPELGPYWATLRRPASADWVDLRTRPSYLRVHGGQSPVGRRAPAWSRDASARCTAHWRPWWSSTRSTTGSSPASPRTTTR
ncbi:hypothetical protein NKG94_05645 [Micromonospora sp. M12]